MTNDLSLSKTKTFRILFEKVLDRGKIGWTTISGCSDSEDAINYFRESFSFDEYEIVQIAEILS